MCTRPCLSPSNQLILDQSTYLLIRPGILMNLYKSISKYFILANLSTSISAFMYMMNITSQVNSCYWFISMGLPYMHPGTLCLRTLLWTARLEQFLHALAAQPSAMQWPRLILRMSQRIWRSNWESFGFSAWHKLLTDSHDLDSRAWSI